MDNSNEEFWSDLADILNVTPRMSGDIDAEQISKEKGISVEAARHVMKEMAATGKYIYQLVIDYSSPNGRRAIIRKAIKS